MDRGRWSIIEKKKGCEFERQAWSQLKEVQKLSCAIQENLAEADGIKTAYDRFASDFQYKRYLEAVENASLRAEKLTGKLRRMVIENATSAREQKEYQVKLTQCHQIFIEYKNEILKVKLPFLLPHRKNKYTDYIYQPLFLAMENWREERKKDGSEVPVYSEAVICFRHVYDRGKTEIRVRDHDNIEEKQVVDALGTFFLKSDGGLYLDTYQTTTMGKEDRTEVFLMNRRRFCDWLEESYRGNSDIEKTRFSK